MAVSKAKKVEQVEELGQEFKKVSSMVVATYSKLTVAQDYEPRNPRNGQLNLAFNSRPSAVSVR